MNPRKKLVGPKRSVVITVRFTPAEYTELILAARAARLKPCSEAELLRQVVLSWSSSMTSDLDKAEVSSLDLESFWSEVKETSSATRLESRLSRSQEEMQQFYEDSMPDEVKEFLRKELSKLEDEQAKVVPSEDESEE